MALQKLKCPYCGSIELTSLPDGTYKCEECERIITQDLKGQLSTISSKAVGSAANAVGSVLNVVGSATSDFGGVAEGKKSKTVAAVLALTMGLFGAQYFYLGQTKKGWISVLLIFTIVGILINEIRGLFQAIGFFCMNKKKFDSMYNS